VERRDSVNDATIPARVSAVNALGEKWRSTSATLHAWAMRPGGVNGVNRRVRSATEMPRAYLIGTAFFLTYSSTVEGLAGPPM